MLEWLKASTVRQNYKEHTSTCLPNLGASYQWNATSPMRFRSYLDCRPPEPFVIEMLSSFIWRNFTIWFQGNFIVALNHRCPYYHLPSAHNCILLSLEEKSQQKCWSLYIIRCYKCKWHWSKHGSTCKQSGIQGKCIYSMLIMYQKLQNLIWLSKHLHEIRLSVIYKSKYITNLMKPVFNVQ